jgi:uncharacterized protein with FMN-binding domain
MKEIKRGKHDMRYMRPIFAAVIMFVYSITGPFPAANAQDREVDLSKVADGIYVGGWLDYGDVPVVVEVTVKKGKIEGIRIIESKGDQYVQDAEAIIEDVVGTQSLKVDAVTGATITSDAMLRAIEDALRKGMSGKVLRRQ